MESQRYQLLNPLAFAAAAGCTELIAALFVAVPMMGMVGWYHPGGMMSWYGTGLPLGFGIAWWIGGGLLTALAGAIFAWIYNAVNAGARATNVGSEPHTPASQP